MYVRGSGWSHFSARLGTGFMLRSNVVSDSNMASMEV